MLIILIRGRKPTNTDCMKHCQQRKQDLSFQHGIAINTAKTKHSKRFGKISISSPKSIFITLEQRKQIAHQCWKHWWWTSNRWKFRCFWKLKLRNCCSNNSCQFLSMRSERPMTSSSLRISEMPSMLRSDSWAICFSKYDGTTPRKMTRPSFVSHESDEIFKCEFFWSTLATRPFNAAESIRLTFSFSLAVWILIVLTIISFLAIRLTDFFYGKIAWFCDSTKEIANFSRFALIKIWKCYLLFSSVEMSSIFRLYKYTTILLWFARADKTVFFINICFA